MDRQKITARVLYRILALFILAAVFIFSAGGRLIDPDEGYYLLAAKLVMQGETPYIDFFFPQMPLLPYVYGAGMKIFGAGWFAARYFSGALGVAMGLLLFSHMVRLTGKQAWGLFAVMLFAFSSFSVGWFATAKTYPVSTLLLFAAYLFLFADRLKGGKYLMAGVCLGLAIDSRFYFIGLIPVFFWLIYREEGKQTGKANPFTAFSLGLVIALGFSLFFLLKNPDNFYFNNIGYHFLRSDYDFSSSIKQKFEALPRLLGWGLTEGFLGLQFALLLLANAYFILRTLRAQKRLPAAGLLVLFLPFMLFIPTPTHIQYFSSLLPFLIINLILLGAPRVEKSGGWRPLWGLAAIAYLLAWPFDYHRYTALGTAVPGVGGGPENAVNWKIETLESVARAVDFNIEAEGEPVLAFWPGYLLESKASVFPKMENHFGVVISPRLNEAEREKYRIISVAEIAEAVSKHEVRLIIFEIWIREPLRSQLLELMQRSGYERILQIGDRELYKWSAAR